MALIDIGAAAIDRGSYSYTNYTIVGKENPANDTGTIIIVEIWAASNLSNCEVATFENLFGNYLSTRDTETIGSVTSGSKQTFSGLDMDVQTGDYLGVYFSSGEIEEDTSGDGFWRASGDSIPCTGEEFASLINRTISLYGTSEAAGWSGKVSGVTNPAKVMGVAKANIAKVKGVASA